MGMASMPPPGLARGAEETLSESRNSIRPDSLGGLYGAITEFLGFEMLDGEFKVMGMAPYGDASRIDVSRLARVERAGVS